ncbi:MAG: hypothetical protein IJH95_08470 [Mogibacterium sp.]|nr:hypothetical protein [Mogibacterium sp.]
MGLKTRIKKLAAAAGVTLMITALCACSGQGTEDAASAAADYLTKADITVNEEIENTEDGGHAVEVSGEEKEYSNVGVSKTGESDGDEADFYGENSAVFVTEKGTLTIKDSLIETNGTHANAVFSYGEGTTVNIADSVIETQGNCSGGLMTTGGGTMNAENLTINTSGNSSAAIRSDRGGGTVTVTKGYYKTTGTGSPVVYSTADITVNDSYMESAASQGIVVEGKNSVTLNNDTLVADNNTKNSDKSDYYQAVMIYQSMSGDADSGTSSFTANGGSISNKNGDIFFVNNTACEIDLTDVEISNEDEDGLFLRAEAAGWGNEGSNGGRINLNAGRQTIEGDISVDDVSVLNMYLKDSSSYMGAINRDGQKGDVYVEIEDGSTWTLTADSYVSGLTVSDKDAIDLNGHKLYIDGKEYEAGSTSKGEAFEISSGSSDSTGGAPEGASGDGQAPPDGGSGGPGNGEKPSGEPPEKPDGSSDSGNKPAGDPPAKPGSGSGSNSNSNSNSNSKS